MKTPLFNSRRLLIVAIALFCALLPAKTPAVIYYWDPNGLSAPTSGTWDTTTPQWSTTSALSASPVVWDPTAAAGFPAGTAGISALTITVNSPIGFAGTFNGLTASIGVTNLVLSGSGSLSLNAGLQGFWTGASTYNTIIRLPITGAGALQNQSSGSLWLSGNNTYSGGTALGTSAGLNFNNGNAFGSGQITNAVTTTVLATPATDSAGATFATAPITIANSMATFGGAANSSLIYVGIAAAPATFTGPWTLANAAGFAATLQNQPAASTVTISGAIGGAANFTKAGAGSLVLSGANTYSGKTSLNAGVLSVSSYNSVSGGGVSSSLGAPATIANGTINIGTGSTTATNVYLGPGETTDRIINLAGTSGGAVIQADGSGPIIFTSGVTATGAGTKTLFLQGTNTGNNTISGVIANNSSANTTAVFKTGTGAWTLTAANTYSGNTTLNTAGKLNIGNQYALGFGTFVINQNGLFDNTSGADMTITNAFTLSGGSPNYVGSANNMTISGPVTISAANRTITVSANTLTLGSVINQDASARNFTKAGAGTLRLLGGTAYTGNTTVSGGSLIIGGSAQMGGGAYGGTITDNATFNYASSVAQTLSGVISGSGTLIQNGPGTLTLSAANTYSGATTVNTGILALTGNGSLANGSSIGIAAGATLDVSGRTSTTFTLGASASLTASGAGTTPGVDAATIVGASGGTIGLGSRPISLTFTPTTFSGDSAHPSLYVSQGALSLNGNVFTINNASGTPLDIGTYVLIQQASGSVTASGIFSANVTGSGVTAGNAGYISVTGGSVNLIVAPAVSFSGLTASQAIIYGAPTITLAGIVSGAGPTYPAQGETITVVIGGVAQSTTINDATGDFSLIYNSSAIPASANPYTITYSYPGNGVSTSAALDTSTTLMVTPAALSVTASDQSKTYGQSIAFGAGGTAFTTTGLQNGETIGSVTLTCAGGDATAPISGSPYIITPSAATGGTFNANNYTITYNTGMLTVNPAVLTVTATGLLIYGDDATNAVYSPQYATLQGTDTLAAITGSANFSTDATSSNYVGSNYLAHVVDIGTLSSPNYVFAPGADGVLTITNRPLDVTNVLADNKVYDGTTAATLDFSGAGLDGFVNGDETNVTLVTTSATGAFNDRNVGVGKIVSVTGLTTAGDLGTNYFLIPPTTTADITKLSVTVTAVADTKTYDGTTTSAGTPVATPPIAPGDTATFSQAFDTKNAGIGKTLSASGFVDDSNDGVNYALTFASVTTGEIDPKPITVTAVPDTKGYDGTAASGGVPSISPALATSDTPNFSQIFNDKNAGIGKILTPGGSVNDGNTGANYAVTFVNDTTGVITTKAITVTAVTDSKIYDGTINSTAAPTVAPGLAPGDTPQFSEAYDTKNVGAGKMLTPSGSVNDGNGGANYSATFVNDTTGAITQMPITVTAVATTKVYDGTTSSSGDPTIGPFLAVGDIASFSQTYDTKNAGTGKTLTPSGSVLDGNSGANYSVTFANNSNGVITLLATTNVLVSSLNPSAFGSNVTFTATVTGAPPAADAPTGQIVFFRPGGPFATNNLVNGSCSASLSDLPVGTNAISAAYFGDDNGNYGQSIGAVDQVVTNTVIYSTTNIFLGIANNNDGTCTLNLLGTPGAQYYIVSSPDVSLPISTWAILGGSTNTASAPEGLWSQLFTMTNASTFFRSVAINPAP